MNKPIMLTIAQMSGEWVDVWFDSIQQKNEFERCLKTVLDRLSFSGYGVKYLPMSELVKEFASNNVK